MKRKVLTLALASTMALGNIIPAFANAPSNTNNTTEKTYIETAIGFMYPEESDALHKKNLKATLSGNNKNVEIPLSKMLSNNESNISSDGLDITLEKIEEEGKIKSIKFKINGLEAADNYILNVEGKNYLKTTINLSTTTFSKRVNISTQNNMILGDVNNDNKIDASDVKLLEENLHSNNPDYDINGDGTVSIADIAIVNNNMVEVTSPTIFDTEMVASKVMEKVQIEALQNSVNVVANGGAIENIFKENEVVKLEPKKGETVVSIPLEFKEVQEMSSISVTLPDGTPKENVKIKVLDENNQEISITDNSEPSQQMMNFRNASETVVTINLGKRVPVKKVVIEVTPTETGYVVVDKVSFLKDVVDENIVDNTKVTNITVKEGNEEVTLSWREVPNVTGYKVYYGESEDNLSKVQVTDKTTVTIDGLENLTTYYFQISATSGDWEGEKSDIISATPKPASKPLKPNFVKAEAGDSNIKISWGKTENATAYDVYARKEDESEFKKVAENISNTEATITGLENDKKYILYVVAKNEVGESPNSDYVEATPKKEIIVAPTLPEKDRIPNSNIASVEMGHKDHYDSTLYPDGFNTEWLYDENYETSWVARRWWEENSFKFTFNEPKDMDYLVWVPRLDGKYRQSHDRYNIDVWLEGDDLSQPGTRIATDRPISNRGEDNSYYVLDFPKQEKVKKIEIKMIQWDGSPTNTNASEVVFYEYNDISDRVERLFANNSKTELASGVTESEIDKLEAEISDITGFVVDKDILLNELNIARGLLKGDNSALGVIKDNIYSINTAKDQEKYQVVNNFQPLGIASNANSKIVIYADIPEGETVELIATQYFAEADGLSATPIKLTNGRNIITVPKIGNAYWDRGGSLYVTYNGNKADEIKLQIIGGEKIPYLELKDFNSLDEAKTKEEIRKFILELEEYVPKLKGNLEHQVLNCSEISLPDVLLSLPANKILEGIKSNATSIDEQVEKVYNTILAWEEVMDIVYKTYGIDNHKTDGLESRQNIRYMRMFGNAFMYAAGNHIGIGYNSVAGLMNGKPVSNLTENDTANNLFGWGIAHEIGHVMDRLGKAEVTNNIYSLMIQTYDGKANTLPSRLETSNIYEKIFEKVSVGNEGIPNNVFVHLGMYWQLHLAYDNKDNPFNFYNELHKAYRTDDSLKSFTDMDKFAVASSKIANKNLTKFFTRWGVKLSEDAKNVMNTYPEEDRAIYYLTDESRRQRINGNTGNTNIAITANAQVNADNPKEVNITITGENSNVQGYEIIRNGKSIGFTTTKEFTDIINSANNMTFEYEVVPVDILGNISTKVSAGQIRISYDKVIDKNLYQISSAEGNNSVITFNEPTIITGIKITPKTGTDLPTGKYTVSIKVAGEENGEEYIIAKNGDFSENLSKDTNAYVGYFNKPGDTSDKMWSYDAVSLKLTGIDTSLYNIDFISYPGDNIEFLDMGIGRLASDYKYGDTEEDVIKAGTLVIAGNYRGNTTTNKIHIKGKFATASSLDENATTEERALNGYTLMFDEIPENGKITSSTTQGLFIFVPDIQKEAEIQGKEPESVSILPTEIKAEMFKEANGGQLMTSDTLWISMPSDESLPQIEIK